MISPTRPRRTASGLSRTRVRSAVSGMGGSLAKRLGLGVAGRVPTVLLLRLVVGDDLRTLTVDLRAQHPAAGVQGGEDQAETEEPRRGQPGGDGGALGDPPEDPAPG